MSWFLVASAAVLAARLTRFIVSDTLIETWRDNRRGNVRKLVTCPWCIGLYIFPLVLAAVAVAVTVIPDRDTITKTITVFAAMIAAHMAWAAAVSAATWIGDNVNRLLSILEAAHGLEPVTDDEHGGDQ